MSAFEGSSHLILRERPEREGGSNNKSYAFATGDVNRIRDGDVLGGQTRSVASPLMVASPRCDTVFQCNHPVPPVSPVPQFSTQRLPLGDIYFYQDYVSNRFMDGRPLTTTIRALQLGTVTPDTLPPVQCLKYRGRWYAMGNRRMACFHYVYHNEPTRSIPVLAKELPDDADFLPQGNGMTVKVGGGMKVVAPLLPDPGASLADAKAAEELAELQGAWLFSLEHCLGGR